MTTRQPPEEHNVLAADPHSVLAPSAQDVLRGAVDWLLAQRRADGTWQRAATATVLEVARSLLLARALDWRHPDPVHAAALIKFSQRPDGGWPIQRDAGSDLAASVLAYAALRTAGESADSYRMALAAGWIRDAGGPDLAGLAVAVWLELAGVRSGPPVPAGPRLSVPLAALADRGSGALRRSAHATAPLLWHHSVSHGGPVGQLPELDLAELFPPRSVKSVGSRSSIPAPRWSPGTSGLIGAARGVFGLIPHDPGESAGVAHRLWRGLAPIASRIVAAQSADGSWGQASLQTACALVALRRLGASADDPATAAGVAWLNRNLPWRAKLSRAPDLSPWSAFAAAADTALALTALADAALPDAGRDDPALPVVLHLDVGPTEARLPDRSLAAACRVDAGPPQLADLRALASSAVRWQRRDGSWGGPAAHGRAPTIMSATFVTALCDAGLAGTETVRRGAAWLLAAQCADGSWRRGPGERTDAHATGAAIRALIRAGTAAADPAVTAATRCLVRRQRADGGWDDDACSTGYAVHALLAAVGPSEPAERGVRWLVDRQGTIGGWERAGLAELCAVISALGGFLRSKC